MQMFSTASPKFRIYTEPGAGFAADTRRGLE